VNSKLYKDRSADKERWNKSSEISLLVQYVTRPLGGQLWHPQADLCWWWDYGW